MTIDRFKPLLVGIALALVAETAFAFPGFARKYSPNTSVFTFMPCAGCHDTFPKLTPFGRRFKENGFRMDGDATTWKDAIAAFPVAVRTRAIRTGIGDGDESNLGVIKPIAAGSLGSWVSFWLEQPIYVDEDDAFDRRDIEHAWVGAYDVLRSMRSGLLNVRGGSFELDLPFTQARTHNQFGYDPYFMNGAGSPWSIAEPQRGLELSGRPWDRGHYSIAVVDSRPRPDIVDPGFDADVYARLAADVSLTHRIGAFAANAREQWANNGSVSTAEHRRLGGDFDLRFPGIGATLNGLYLFGQDIDERNKYAVRGGFVQFDKQALDWLLLTARYTHVNVATESRQNVAFGAYGWFLERLKIGFEYRFQEADAADSGVFSVDFVF